MVIYVSLKAVGMTSVTTPVILLVNDTLVDSPMVNLCPYKVKLPVLISVEEIFYNNGLFSSLIKVNQQLSPEDEQFVGMINLLSTVTT